MGKSKLIAKNKELEAKIVEMRSEIFRLIDDPDSIEAMEIKWRYNFHRDFVRLISHSVR